jgi:hypothetical protein
VYGGLRGTYKKSCRYASATLLKQIQPKHESKQVSRSDAAEDELDVLIRRAEEMRIQEQKGMSLIICVLTFTQSMQGP